MIFVGRDRFSMKIKFKNSNIFTDFDKIDLTLKGQKILENKDFEICCINYLDPLGIPFQNQN